MLLAILHLTTGAAAEIAADFVSSMRLMPAASRADTRAYLWEELSKRAAAGEVEFRGVRTGSRVAEVIPPMALRGSKPDFQADTLEAAGATFYGVGVFRTPAAAQAGARASMAPAFGLKAHSHPGRGSPDLPSKRRGNSLRDVDAPLLAEMRQLIMSGRATGPLNAARAVADRAKGAGTADSKARRLAGKFNRAQSGQSTQS